MIRRRLVLVLAAVCLLSWAALRAAEPATDDAWYVITDGDAAFGSVHRQHHTDARGNLHVRQQTRLLLDLLGQRQELQETVECVVDRDFHPLSYRSELSGSSGTKSVSGHVEGKQFVLAIERGDVQFERRIPIPDTHPLVIDACLPEVLAARRDAKEPFELTILETGAWDPREVTARRLPDADGHVRFELTGRSDNKGTWSLDDDGNWVASRTKSGLIERSTERAAAQLTHRKYANHELLLFPTNRNVPFPERVKSMTVKLTWKGTPLSALQLEDARQQLVHHGHNGDRHEVELRLTQPVMIDGAAPLPVEDPELAPYLAETQFIRPHDPSIEKKSREWTVGSKTTLEAVERLTHEVNRFMEGGDLIAETLSGPEVLACGQGKCSEFTTLLASLARSAGVPTRVALGMRLIGGQWIGHMWCEVWVGRWIPVDATVDEVGGSPALLKLTHSDTVLGTQAARFAVAKSLEIEITEVESDPALASTLTTGIVGPTYSNADFGCRITAPAADWKVSDKSTSGVATIRFEAPAELEKGEPLVHFVAFGLPGAVDPAIIVNSRKALFSSQYKDLEVLADEEQPVGDLKGRRFVFRRQNPESPDEKIKTTEYVWIHGRSGFLLNVIAEESVHDAVIEQVEGMLQKFELPEAEAKP